MCEHKREKQQKYPCEIEWYIHQHWLAGWDLAGTGSLAGDEEKTLSHAVGDSSLDPPTFSAPIGNSRPGLLSAAVRPWCWRRWDIDSHRVSAATQQMPDGSQRQTVCAGEHTPVAPDKVKPVKEQKITQ